MVLVRMSHEEYIKFCKKIANRYLIGLILCIIIFISEIAMFMYIKLPFESFIIIASGLVISVIFLGSNFIYWRYIECR